MVSLDPQPALRIDTQAIGPRISIALNIAHQIGAPRLEIGTTGQNEDFPCKLRCQRRVAPSRPFNDVTMPLFHTETDCIGTFPPAIVRQTAINSAVVLPDRDP